MPRVRQHRQRALSAGSGLGNGTGARACTCGDARRPENHVLREVRRARPDPRVERGQSPPRRERRGAGAAVTRRARAARSGRGIGSARGRVPGSPRVRVRISASRRGRASIGGRRAGRPVIRRTRPGADVRGVFTKFASLCAALASAALLPTVLEVFGAASCAATDPSTGSTTSPEFGLPPHALPANDPSKASAWRRPRARDPSWRDEGEGTPIFRLQGRCPL